MWKYIIELLFGSKLDRLSKASEDALSIFKKTKDKLMTVNDSITVHEQEIKKEMQDLMNKVSLKKLETETIQKMRDANQKLHDKIHELLS